MTVEAVHKVACILTIAAAILTAASGVASADFLGLAPGDYVVTLTGSSALCGGADCTGSVHVPATNLNLVSDFDWSFLIGSQAFDWAPPANVDTDISPNGANSCAIEGESPTLCIVTDTGTSPALNVAPFLALFDVNDQQRYSVILAGGSRGRSWRRRPRPCPSRHRSSCFFPPSPCRGGSRVADRPGISDRPQAVDYSNGETSSAACAASRNHSGMRGR